MTTAQAVPAMSHDLLREAIEVASTDPELNLLMSELNISAASVALQMRSQLTDVVETSPSEYDDFLGNLDSFAQLRREAARRHRVTHEDLVIDALLKVGSIDNAKRMVREAQGVSPPHQLKPTSIYLKVAVIAASSMAALVATFYGLTPLVVFSLAIVVSAVLAVPLEAPLLGLVNRSVKQALDRKLVALLRDCQERVAAWAVERESEPIMQALSRVYETALRVIDSWVPYVRGQIRAIVNQAARDRAAQLAAETERIAKETKKRQVEERTAQEISRDRLWGTHLLLADTSGLDDAEDLERLIPVPALARVRDLISSPTVGSVGVAGVRGAGKTTILRKLTQTPASNTRDGPSFSLMVSAPVDYTAREFLLFLYARVCSSVLGEEQEPLELPTPTHPDPIRLVHSLIVEFTRGPGIVALGGLTCISATVLLGAPRWWLPIGAAAVSAILILLLESHRRAVIAGFQPDLRRFGPDSPDSEYELERRSRTQLGQRLAKVHRVYGIPLLFSVLLSIFGGLGVILGWTLAGSSTLWIAAMLRQAVRGNGARLRRFIGLRSLSTSGQPATELGSQSYSSDSIVNSEYTPERLQVRARATLHAIRFQLSYSSGWSGSLNVGIPSSGTSMTSALSAQHGFAENQRTMPELVDSFRSFLADLARTSGPVLVAIDEIDKIIDPNTAIRFVNDLKAVFGVPNVHFVSSISEDALAMYESRGVDIRSDFDGAFDQVVWVGPLRLGETIALIEQRVIGAAIPFMALVHVLAGGLPREIVRTLRDVGILARDAQAEASPLDLSAVAERLALDIIDRSAQGILLASRCDDTLPNSVKMGWVRMLRVSSSGEIAEAVEDVLRSVELAMSTPISKSSTEVGDPNLLKLIAFCSRVMTIVDYFRSDRDWEKEFPGGHGSRPEGSKSFEDFVESSSLIGSQPLVAIERTSSFRRIANLPELGRASVERSFASRFRAAARQF